MSTVTAKLEDAQRIGNLLVEQLTAPGEVHAGRARPGQGRRRHVRRDRPGQVLSGLLRRCDRSLRTISVGDPESLRKLQEQVSAA